MALFRKKKEEFRPDAPTVRFSSRFYLSPVQRRKWLKWFLFSALCLVLLLLLAIGCAGAQEAPYTMLSDEAVYALLGERTLADEQLQPLQWLR